MTLKKQIAEALKGTVQGLAVAAAVLVAPAGCGYLTASALHVGWLRSRSELASFSASHAIGLLALRLSADRIAERQRQDAEREAYRGAAVDDCVKRGDQPVQGLALSVVCVRKDAVKQ